MDFALSEDQRAIVDALGQLLERHAGASRGAELAAKGEYDAILDGVLAEAGFDALLLDGEETGPLEAALACEAVARAGGAVAFAATALVAPAVAKRRLPGPVALATVDDPGPVRFAFHARTLLLVDGDSARIVELTPGDVTSLHSNFGYPFGRLSEESRSRGKSLGPGSGERLLAWWRVALSAEMLGTMDAALGFTVAYLNERQQFGRPIGAFQAVQHRLAECAIAVESARWLVYETAAQGARATAAATTAGFASIASGRVHRETHQLSGAIGYTTDHDLHVWSMRLQALRLELGGAGAHFRSLARQRWGRQRGSGAVVKEG